MTDPAYVFVYGTLKPGHRNAHWAEAVAQPEARGGVLDGFTLHHLGRYPGIAPAAEQRVRGVLYRYLEAQMPAVLRQMDELEDYHGPGHPDNLYTRELRPVQAEGGETVTAWVYIYARPLPAGSLIKSGEWTAEHETQRG